ncbi:normal mucosa of esophagus-specific gene 1 protein-like [Glandiceps talaboti]
MAGIITTRLVMFRPLINHPQYIPVCTVAGATGTCAASYMIYMATTKSDITWRYNISAPWDVVDPSTPQKFMTYSQKYKPNTEVTKLRDELNAAYKPSN